MGTRSLTVIKKSKDEEICVMYRQYDGCPSGHGQELVDFLKQGKLVNGITHEDEDEGLLFNGMDCLAAQIMAHFKDGPGNIYLMRAGTRNAGEEYIYTVLPDGKELRIKVESGCMTFFGLPGTEQKNMNLLFDGKVKDFSVAACELREKQLEAAPNDFINNKDTETI